MSPSTADVRQLLVKPLPRLRTQSCVSVEVDVPADGDNPCCTDNTASPPAAIVFLNVIEAWTCKEGPLLLTPQTQQKQLYTLEWCRGRRCPVSEIK